MTYVTELKDSNLAVSIINLSETIPILFTVFFGIIADRTMNKVETIIKTLWIRVGLYLLVAMVMNFKASIMVVILASMVNLVSKWSFLPNFESNCRKIRERRGDGL